MDFRFPQFGYEWGRLRSAPPGPVYDPDAQLIFNSLEVQPKAALKDRIELEVLGLKSSGLWALISCMQVALNHSQSMSVNWKGGAVLGSAVNNPVFSPFRGYTTDGVSSYFNTGYVPAEGPIYKGANAHISFRELATGNSDARNIASGNALSFISRTRERDRFWMRINSLTQIDIQGASPSSPGVYLGTRSASAQQGYRNGTTIGSGTADATPAFDNAPIWLGRMGSSYRATQIAAWTAGAFLTAAQAQTLSNRLVSLTNDLLSIGA